MFTLLSQARAVYTVSFCRYCVVTAQNDLFTPRSTILCINSTKNREFRQKIAHA